MSRCCPDLTVARAAGYRPAMTRNLAVLVAGLIGVGCVSAAGAEPPVVFWASDPVRPGEAVMVLGHALGDKPTVEVVRLNDGPCGEAATAPPASAPATQPAPDAPGRAASIAWPGGGRAVEALQASQQSLKFVLPADLAPGLFAFRITTAGQEAVGVLNRPRVWWGQGDLGISASPGGWLTLYGLNLAEGAWANPPAAGVTRASRRSVVRLRGPKTLTLEADCSPCTARLALPADLPCGRYEVSLHRGWGGEPGWSEPVLLDVRERTAWPATVFNVRDFGAEGDGVKDDTAAVQAALAKAGQAGGGVVHLPRGRYRLSEGLTVPRLTVLRGERRDLACLAWTDLADPPEALVRGANSFALEELTLYARNYRHVIVGDQPGRPTDRDPRPDAGDVRLLGVVVRANAYRGHLTPAQVDERFRASLKHSTGGGDTVRLGGRNIEIRDCDLYGSGRVLYLSRVRGGLVRGNRLYNGRWGWYCISGSDGVVFDHNTLVGADLMSTGGGLNCLDGSTSSQNVFFGHNRLSLMHGWDREAMTTDAGGELYFGKVASAEGAKLTLAAEPTTKRPEWGGAGVFILAGRGAGQYRRVVARTDQTVEIDRPWAVAPDGESELAITMFQGHYLVVDNEFADCGAMQFYGTSIECLVAGNRGTRMPGLRGLGLWYHGYQPSWFCQFLDNELAAGNYYHFDSVAEASLEVFGARRPPYEGPMNRCAVVRRNRLLGNAHVRVGGASRDVIVEANRVANADQGVFVSRTCAGVLTRGNAFENVVREVVGEEALRLAALERLKRFMGRQEPIASWSFEALTGKRFADGADNGFVAAIRGDVRCVAGGIRGQAVRFDGAGCLAVEEPAVFNAPDITVSLWVKPAKVTGRRGLIAKRFAGAGAPLVVSQNGAALAFESCEENGRWTFNFGSPPVLKENQWTHVAVAVKQGEGITIYADGQAVAEKKNPALRATNREPLILGREAWGGEPPKGDTPGFYVGLMDEVKVWTRTLSADEVRQEYESSRKVQQAASAPASRAAAP